MSDEKSHFQLAYFPYLALKNDLEEIRFRRITIWNADTQLNSRVSDPALRKRVAELLDMNTQSANTRRSASRVPGMGIVTIGDEPFRELTAEEAAEVEDARIALFLAGLDYNTSIKRGANAGHYLYTSENFSVVYQNFTLTSEFVAERSGVIVEFKLMGLKISETIFPKPSYVNQPLRPGIDRALLRELEWLHETDQLLLRRIMRASREFLSAYYNAPSVDLDSRIFAQVMAFEILLDLPESRQRREFKDRLQALCDDKKRAPSHVRERTRISKDGGGDAKPERYVGGPNLHSS